MITIMSYAVILKYNVEISAHECSGLSGSAVFT